MYIVHYFSDDLRDGFWNSSCAHMSIHSPDYVGCVYLEISKKCSLYEENIQASLKS